MDKKQTYLTNKRSHQRRRDKRIRMFLSAFFLVLLAGAMYGAKLLATTHNIVGESYHEIERQEKIIVEPAKDPTSILIMGVDNNDTRQLDSTRTDAMIYLTMNPHTNKINMVSIPRDSYTELIHNGELVEYNRINAAYGIGKEQTAVESVEHLLQVPVHYYATIDFDAFMDIIDALGGVEVDVPIEFTESNAPGRSGAISLNKGMQTLDGEEALALARTRKIDNDVKRGERQQLIVQAIIQKALKLNSIPRYTQAIESVSGNMKTNMRMNDMIAIMKSGMTSSYSITSHTFDWYDYDHYGASMIKLEENSLEKMRETFKYSLEETQPSTHQKRPAIDTSQ